MENIDIKRIIKLKVQEQLYENISLAKSKCDQAYEILEYALNDKNLVLIEKAASLYLEALELYSRFVEPYLALGYLFWKMGMYSQAQKFINKALDIEPSNQDASIMLNNINEDFKKTQFLKNSDTPLNKFLADAKRKNKHETGFLSGFMSTMNKIFKIANNFKEIKKTNNDFSAMVAETVKKMGTLKS